MSLVPGTLAPAFETEDLFGKRIALGDYAGKLLLLSFFRNAACAICNLRVHQLIGRYPRYKRAGLALVAVFESPRERMLDYVGMQDAPFPLVADPEATLYDRYKVETSAEKIAQSMTLPQTKSVIAAATTAGFPLTPEEGSNFNRMPADFLIDGDGRVLRAHYASHVSDHMPFEVIDEYLNLHSITAP